MNREVNLSKRVQTSKGLRYCPVVTSANGRIKPDVVLIDGKEERHTEGAYYLSWYQGRKLIRLSVGKDAADAGARRLQKEAELNAANNGEVPQTPSRNGQNGQNGHRSVAVAVTGFLDETKLTKKPKTLAAYSTALKYFQESCPKLYLEDIERKDLLKFSAFLRDEKEQAPRSCWNKFSNVMSFLKAHGIRGLVGKNDWPRFVEEEPEVYSNEDLKQFFAACDSEEHLWFDFLLKTAMREQELMHTSWSDINFGHSSVFVRYKPEYGFSPKTYRERQIPIPKKLTQELKEFKSKSDKTCGLVFPTAGCRPKLNFLDCCKVIAKRAGLAPANWWLHKFRATAATRMLQKGIDLKSVQRFLGHKDIESTMRYLAAQQNDVLQKRVEEVW